MDTKYTENGLILYLEKINKICILEDLLKWHDNFFLFSPKEITSEV